MTSINIIARYSDKNIVSFKVRDSEYEDIFNTPNVFCESWFKLQVEKHNFLIDNDQEEGWHEDSRSHKSVKAPFHKGILLFDYFNKNMFSSNYRTPFLLGSSWRLLQEYFRLVENNFLISVKNVSLQTTEQVDVRKNNLRDINETHYVFKALEHHAKIYKNSGKNKEEIKHNGTIESVISQIYAIDLENKTTEEQTKAITEYLYNEVQNTKELGLSGIFDIEYVYPHFNILLNDSTTNIKDVMYYMIDNDFYLTEYEKDMWYDYLQNKEE